LEDGEVNFRKNGGLCKESVILKPCDNYYSLMNPADSFKNEISRGAENLGAIKRSILCSSIIDKCHGGKLIAACDNTGILQVNNMNSGNLISSLTSHQNKLLISKI